jgi:transposase-like protein
VILEPRRRIDQALYAVVMEAYVNGVSTRAVDDLVTALGIDSGISKSEVSRICAGLDQTVAAFRSRPLHHTTFPYLFLDATYLHVRRTGAGGQVTSMAVVIATGVTATGGREVLGVDVGDSEGVLARLPAIVEGTRPARHPAGDFRPAQRPGSRTAPHPARAQPPALPGALRP